MTRALRRRPRMQKESAVAESKQETMDDYLYSPSSTYLVQKFALNSYHRVVARKGLGRKPQKHLSSSSTVRSLTGQKCSNIDLKMLTQSFDNYRKVVNLILEKVYADFSFAQSLGEELDGSNSKMLYLILREKRCFKWTNDNEFGQLVYERMHRNALETAARIILGNHTRRRLVNAALEILSSDDNELLRLVRNRRVPVDLVRRVKDAVGKRSAGAYHYALSACRQVRRVLRSTLRDAFSVEDGESKRKLTAPELLDQKSPHRQQAQLMLVDQVKEWTESGFPFITPTFQKDTMDFSASTENTTGQGYWFMPDPERENEIVLYIKTPPGVIEPDEEAVPVSPYRSQTVRLRFLNWFPRKAARARRKAQEAREQGDLRRAVQLEFRADKFDDMSQQLSNMMRLQHLTREIARERAQPERDKERINDLKAQIHVLRQSRRSAPPIIRVVGKKVTLLIPFMAPDEPLLRASLQGLGRRTRRAGVDRGLRHSMVVSVRNGGNTYEESMISRQELYERRECLRQRTRVLMSQIARKRNNWERKHPRQQPPAYILKKERELESVWQKVRRLDREIAHQVASETVWFCETHGVKTIYFEDLRSFQARAGMRTHSWNLSTNLWGKMIDGVRYRREALGHRNGGIWMVNPAWTSQTCHVCGERGVRVEDETSTTEMRGGEYFYCAECEEHFHADINAARNIMFVQQPEPSAVSGRTA